MKRIVKTELYKIANSSSTYIIALFSLALYFLMSKVSGVFDAEGDLTMALATSIRIMPLFTALIIIPVAQNDIHNGTMKNIVGTGITRNHIYFGKLTSAFIAGMGLYLVNVLFAIAMCMMNGYSFTLSIGEFVATLIGQIVVVADYIMVFYVFSNLLKSNMSSLIAACALFLGSSFVFTILETKFNISNAKQFDLGIISGNISNLEISTGVVLHLAVTTAVIIAVCSLVAIPFKNKEIK